MSNNLPRLSNVLRSNLKLEIKRNLNNDGAEYLAYQLWKENEQTKYVNRDVICGHQSLTLNCYFFSFHFFFQFNNMENAKEFDSKAVFKRYRSPE